MRRYAQITNQGNVIDKFYSHVADGSSFEPSARRLYNEDLWDMEVGAARKFTGTTWLFRYQ